MALRAVEDQSEAVAVPAFRAFIDALWGEAQTTLNPPPELDLAAYRDELMARFSGQA